MKKTTQTGLFGCSGVLAFCAAITAPMPLMAQTSENDQDGNQSYALEEIIVTGRKREEVLQDIPVSISVLNGSTLADQNVLDQGDLADLVPGLYYNQGNGRIDDRIAALPSIRGVSSSEIATTRTKVSSFVDGMPILGSVGAINIGGATQVEVYSGPQSAAFGRSTFAGAINYVTADPGEELTGSVGINWSDQGTRILSGNAGGPISDTLGFQLSGSYEDSVSPDSSLYTYSDGVEAGTRGGLNAAARFVWAPTDSLKAKLTFSRDETDDGPSSSFYATQQSSLDCFNSLDTFDLNTGMGPLSLGVDGEFDCEFDVDESAGLQAVNDITRYYEQNPAALQAAVDAAIAAGATDGEFGDYTVEEAIRLISDGYSVPSSEVGSQNERDRVSLQVDYILANDSAVQVSLMRSEEEYIRQASPNDSIFPLDTLYIPGQPATVDMGMAIPATEAAYFFGDLDAMGMIYADADPTEIEETYFEARWASPAADRIRYVVGASYYEYDFATIIYNDGGYNSVRNGTTDDIFALTGVVVEPSAVISEFAENSAIFFNTSYDFTDKITGSLEGRYASDKVGGFLPADDIRQTQTTKTFTPRIGLNFSPNEETTYYLQYAVGVNPGGVNADMLNPDLRETLDNGVPVDLDPTDADETTENIISVDYDSDDYVGFDEEKLTNYEIGFKGTAFDGRMTYAGAIYYMDWEDAVQPINLDWDYTFADDDLAGTLVEGTVDTYYVAETDDTSVRLFGNSGTSSTKGIEFQARFQVNENWSVDGNTSLMDAKYTDYCSPDLYLGVDNDLGEFAQLEVATNDVGDTCYVLDGKKLANQPAFTLSLSPTYRTELNNGLQFSVNARLQYTGSQYDDVANVTKIPATERVNLTFGLSRDAWSGTFYIENIFDDKTSTGGALVNALNFAEDYPDNVLDPSLYLTADGGVTNYSSYSINEPIGRTFGFRANYNF